MVVSCCALASALASSSTAYYYDQRYKAIQDVDPPESVARLTHRIHASDVAVEGRLKAHDLVDGLFTKEQYVYCGSTVEGNYVTYTTYYNPSTKVSHMSPQYWSDSLFTKTQQAKGIHLSFDHREIDIEGISLDLLAEKIYAKSGGSDLHPKITKLINYPRDYDNFTFSENAVKNNLDLLLIGKLSHSSKK